MYLKSELKAILLTLSRDGHSFFDVFELTESSINLMFQSGNSAFQIIDSFLKTGSATVSNGIFKDFKLQIWNGQHWYVISHSHPHELNGNQSSGSTNSHEFIGIQKSYNSLTPSEKRFLKLSSQGLDEKSICIHLKVSLNTVKCHRKQVYKKLGFRNKSELILWCEKYLFRLSQD